MGFLSIKSVLTSTDYYMHEPAGHPRREEYQFYDVGWLENCTGVP